LETRKATERAVAAGVFVNNGLKAEQRLKGGCAKEYQP
jgi:hypothetical protein